MAKPRTLANTVSNGGPLADGSISASEVSGLAAVATSGSFNDLGDKPTANSYLPAQTGQAGKFLKTDGTNSSWDAVPATTPAGSTGQVQINNSGAFGAISSGTTGQLLTSAGAGAAPTWTNPSAGALVFISSVTASNSATVSFTGIGATYDAYLITLADVLPASGTNNFQLTFSADNGSTYLSSGYAYSSAVFYNSSNGTGGGSSQTSILLNGNLSTYAGSVFCGNVYLYGLASAATYPTGTAQLNLGAAPPIVSSSSFSHSTAQAINAVRFSMSTGNITSGTFRLYGISNS